MKDIPALLSWIGKPRATAVAVLFIAFAAQASGSVYLLNREDDCIPMESGNELTCGVNLLVQANDNQGRFALRSDAGIILSSRKNGSGPDRRYAGENRGGGTVYASYTLIRQDGSYSLQGSSRWIETPQNECPDVFIFRDPLRGKGQPPAPAGLPDFVVVGGLIRGPDDPARPPAAASGTGAVRPHCPLAGPGEFDRQVHAGRLYRYQLRQSAGLSEYRSGQQSVAGVPSQGVSGHPYLRHPLSASRRLGKGEKGSA